MCKYKILFSFVRHSKKNRCLLLIAHARYDFVLHVFLLCRNNPILQNRMTTFVIFLLVFSSLPYQIQWVQQTCSLVNLVPRCVCVKSRGALLCAFARDGLLLAVAVNQTDPKVCVTMHHLS